MRQVIIKDGLNYRLEVATLNLSLRMFGDRLNKYLLVVQAAFNYKPKKKLIAPGLLKGGLAQNVIKSLN